MFGAISNFITRRKVKQLNELHGKRFDDWEKVKKVAVFIDAPGVSKSEMDKFFESWKKYITVFYIELSAPNKTYGDWKCFTAKSKTIFGMPKEEVMNEVGGEKYDLAISACRQHTHFIARVFAQCHAPYKCAMNDVFGECSLVIKANESGDALSYLKEVTRYLQMIRPADSKR